VPPKKTEPPEPSKALEKARAKHRRLAKKLQATQDKLAKRTRKLRKLESDIAWLESRTHPIRAISAPGSLPSPEEDRGLRPIRLIYNPKSGDSDKSHSLEVIVAALRAHGMRADVGIKASARVARDLASAAADDKAELLVVAGGDSTIEEVAPQLLGTSTTLGIIAAGTMNNVARSLGIPLDLDEACALLSAGSTRQVDVGHVVSGGNRDVDYFLETAGLGLSGIAFSAGRAAQKGPLAGLPGSLVKFFEHKPDAVQVELDNGETVLASAQLVTVSNAPLMGLNFLIAPQAKMDDGLLDIAVYDGMSKSELVQYFLTMKDGKRADDARVKFYRARKVRIRSQAVESAESDKNPLPEANRLEVEVLPLALKVIVGRAMALNLPVDAAQSLSPPVGPKGEETGEAP
jgi:diacylglycerol kinase (ATP)